MKSFMCILVTASLVASLPQYPQDGPAVQTAPEAQAATASLAPPAPVNPYGAKFYGPGLTNPLAIKPDPGLIAVAKQIIQSNPNLRSRVLLNGEVEITDVFGIRRNVVDAFGKNPLEAFDPEERLELEQERRELELKHQFNQERLRLRQQQMQQQLGVLGQTNVGVKVHDTASQPSSHFFVTN